MRLWEIKQHIDQILTEEKTLHIDYESIYWNQAYIIHNYRLIIKVLEILSEQKRNDINQDWIQSIFNEFGIESDSLQISAIQFNELNNYVSQLNKKIPLYYSILDTMVDQQDEQLINIKLPIVKIQQLIDLSSINKRLDSILKSFNIDWEYEFKWVDKWTTRYEVLIVWGMTYKIFVACLDIAYKILEIRKQYWESETAILDYKAALKDNDEYNEKGLESYKEIRLKLELESSIKNITWLNQVKNWKSEVEVQNQLIKSTTALIKEMGEWTEFHLSLNPPEYAKELWWSLVIDYKKIIFLSNQADDNLAMIDKRSENSEE
jgi:hypothetical protein